MLRPHFHFIDSLINASARPTKRSSIVNLVNLELIEYGTIPETGNWLCLCESSHGPETSPDRPASETEVSPPATERPELGFSILKLLPCTCFLPWAMPSKTYRRMSSGTEERFEAPLAKEVLPRHIGIGWRVLSRPELDPSVWAHERPRPVTGLNRNCQTFGRAHDGLEGGTFIL